MIVLHLNKFYRPAGGAEVYLLALEKYLNRHGHQSVPFAMADSRNLFSPYSRFFPPAANFRRAAGPLNLLRMSRLFWSLAAARHLNNLLRHLYKTKHWPKVAHVHNLYHQLTPSVLPVLNYAGLPVVMTIHDMHFFGTDYAETRLEDILCHLELRLHKRLKVFEKYADLVITPSRFAEKQLIRWGLPGRKIVYLKHAVEPLPKPRAAVKRRPFLHVVFVGRLAPEKGVPHLLEALTQVPPKVTATIVGEGQQRQALERYAQFLGLNGRVEFVGHKTGLNLSQEILKGQITAVPSAVPEVFGLTMVEAFSLGRPVLAFNPGAAPEIITHAKTGWLTEPNSEALAQGIREVLHSQSRLAAMGRAAQAELKKYRYADYLPKLLAVYKKAGALRQ